MTDEGTADEGTADEGGAEQDTAGRRARMVADDIAGRGVHHPGVLRAMAEIPRERFVPPALADFAYDDHPLPIGEGQTISQPFIVALMAEAAEPAPTDRVLEVGTGSGYGAAVLARVAGRVWTVERHAALADGAARVLAGLGIDNVTVRAGDGSLGLPEAAPFDAIVVTAGGPHPPAALLAQLSDGGRLVMPVGPDRDQDLVRIRRVGDGYREESLGPVRFVPLIGAEGFEEGGS